MSIAGALLPMAMDLGLPMVGKILEGKIGAGNAALVENVVRTVAKEVGANPVDLPAVIKTQPKKVEQALLEAEEQAPEWIEVYLAGIEHQTTIMKMEQAEPWWAWAWRPGMMWLFGFLWTWNLVIIHVLNAIFKTRFPVGDLGLLLQLNLAYMALYMGGHTLKDGLSKWLERSGPR